MILKSDGTLICGSRPMSRIHLSVPLEENGKRKDGASGRFAFDLFMEPMETACGCGGKNRQGRSPVRTRAGENGGCRARTTLTRFECAVRPGPVRLFETTGTAADGNECCRL